MGNMPQRRGNRLARGPMGGDQFTQIHNWVFRDARLTGNAMAVFGHLSTHALGWESTVETVQQNINIGRDAIRTALLLLERHHYLIRHQLRNDDGTLADSVWYYTDLPAQFRAIGIEDDDLIATKVAESFRTWMADENMLVTPMTDNPSSAATCDDRELSTSGVPQSPWSGENPQVTPMTAEPPAAEPPADNPTQENTNHKNTITREDPPSPYVGESPPRAGANEGEGEIHEGETDTADEAERDPHSNRRFDKARALLNDIAGYALTPEQVTALSMGDTDRLVGLVLDCEKRRLSHTDIRAALENNYGTRNVAKAWGQKLRSLMEQSPGRGASPTQPACGTCRARPGEPNSFRTVPIDAADATAGERPCPECATGWSVAA